MCRGEGQDLYRLSGQLWGRLDGLSKELAQRGARLGPWSTGAAACGECAGERAMGVWVCGERGILWLCTQLSVDT